MMDSMEREIKMKLLEKLMAEMKSAKIGKLKPKAVVKEETVVMPEEEEEMTSGESEMAMEESPETEILSEDEPGESDLMRKLKMMRRAKMSKVA